MSNKFVIQYKAKNRKKYDIDEVMNLYAESLENKTPLFVDGFQIHVTPLFKYAYKTYMKFGEIRCPICKTKASHFRLMKGNCLLAFCFRKSKLKNTTYYTYFNIDHIVPKSKGGSNAEKNKQYSCLICNSLKANFINAKDFSDNEYEQGMKYITEAFQKIGIKQKYRSIFDKCVNKVLKEFSKYWKKRCDKIKDIRNNFNFKDF